MEPCLNMKLRVRDILDLRFGESKHTDSLFGFSSSKQSQNFLAPCFRVFLGAAPTLTTFATGLITDASLWDERIAYET